VVSAGFCEQAASASDAVAIKSAVAKVFFMCVSLLKIVELDQMGVRNIINQPVFGLTGRAHTATN
jgi:hypothetical protein